MGRKFFVGGNWKMNGNKQSCTDLLSGLKGLNADAGK